MSFNSSRLILIGWSCFTERVNIYFCGKWIEWGNGVSSVTNFYVFHRWISGAAVVNAFYSSGRNQIGKVYP